MITNNVITKKIINNINNLLNKANLDFDGFIFFIDNNYNLIKVFKASNEENEIKEFLNMYNTKPLNDSKLLHNTAANLCIKLRKPAFLDRNEHLDDKFNNFTGYAEPVIVNNKLIGSLCIYIKNTEGKKEKKDLIYNILRIIMESCLINKESSKKNLIKPSKGFTEKYNFNDFVFKSQKLKALVDKAKIISKTDKPVLILGESGTGKEILGNAIHSESLRNKGPFVAVNCAALTKTLAESEIFGYTEGAFTGALKGGRKGKVELADGGTLFLDEIGDLPTSSQAILLRVLQEKEFIKIGDENITKVDIRLICATNKDLKKMCDEGSFRWDLYYRICGFTLYIPSLRKRKKDIKVLVNYYIEKLNKEKGNKKNITDEAVDNLIEYNWPGNVRELFNVLESLYLLCNENLIKKEDILDLLSINEFVDEVILDKENKRDIFFEVLDKMEGKVSKAAQKVGISRATAYRWIKENE
jgi:transcriptional regulator with PAS, ATPase and Fis domain